MRRNCEGNRRIRFPYASVPALRTGAMRNVLRKTVSLMHMDEGWGDLGWQWGDEGCFLTLGQLDNMYSIHDGLACYPFLHVCVGVEARGVHGI